MLNNWRGLRRPKRRLFLRIAIAVALLVVRRLNQIHSLICTLVHRCRRQPFHQPHTTLVRRQTEPGIQLTDDSIDVEEQQHDSLQIRYLLPPHYSFAAILRSSAANAIHLLSGVGSLYNVIDYRFRTAQ